MNTLNFYFQPNTLYVTFSDSESKTVEYLQSSTQQTQFPPIISFSNNEIYFCENESQHSNQFTFDTFIQEMIENPNEYKTITFEYQQTQYCIHEDLLITMIVWYFCQRKQFRKDRKNTTKIHVQNQPKELQKRFIRAI